MLAKFKFRENNILPGSANTLDVMANINVVIVRILISNCLELSKSPPLLY